MAIRSSTTGTSCSRCWRSRKGIVVPLLKKLGVDVSRLRERVQQEIARFPKQSDAQPTLSRELNKVLDKAEEETRKLGDEYVSTEHLLLALSETKGTESKAVLEEFGVNRAALLEALQAVRGSHRVTDQTPENQYQALAEVHPRPHRRRARRQARSGHRPRRGDSPRHPGAVAPHEEQPRAHRRARRRQDGHRRRARAAHRQRRRARERSRTSGSSRSTSAR